MTTAKARMDGGDDSEEDPEMELFANQVIEKEMKKMTKQTDDLDDEDDDVLGDLENEQDDDEDMENVLMTPKELEEAILDGEPIDAKSISSFCLARPFLKFS